MNTQLLIDSIVRQTTVLIAGLATSRGLRAPLSQIADQVFLELACEIEAQGVSRQVSADMFGLALRSYRRRIQRLRESSTDSGKSLWEAVLDYLASGEVRSRSAVVRRFRRDDEALVRAILTDLCDSGLAFRSGRGESTAYRAVSSHELEQMAGESDEGFAEILWVLIYREGPLSRSALSERTRLQPEVLERALSRLLGAGRIAQKDGGHFEASRVVLMQDEASGWQAAMFDHYQALVRTLCARLQSESAAESVGGSTYTFDVSPEHPLASDVKGTLARLRAELGALWDRVEAHNQSHPPSELEQVIVYFGQSSRKEDQ